jgi:hypothetical protein
MLEAIRWAFGFGTEATVIAPEPAVRLAVQMLEEMLSAQHHVAKIAPIGDQRSTAQSARNSSMVSPA